MRQSLFSRSLSASTSLDGSMTSFFVDGELNVRVQMGLSMTTARFAEALLHMYMFCPYVISALYHSLEE